jgi:hypothetical protein
MRTSKSRENGNQTVEPTNEGEAVITGATTFITMTLFIMTFSIEYLEIMTFSITMLSIMKLGITMLS